MAIKNLRKYNFQQFKKRRFFCYCYPAAFQFTCSAIAVSRRYVFCVTTKALMNQFFGISNTPKNKDIRMYYLLLFIALASTAGEKTQHRLTGVNGRFYFVSIIPARAIHRCPRVSLCFL